MMKDGGVINYVTIENTEKTKVQPRFKLNLGFLLPNKTMTKKFNPGDRVIALLDVVKFPGVGVVQNSLSDDQYLIHQLPAFGGGELTMPASEIQLALDLQIMTLFPVDKCIFAPAGGDWPPNHVSVNWAAKGMRRVMGFEGLWYKKFFVAEEFELLSISHCVDRSLLHFTASSIFCFTDDLLVRYE